MQAFVQMVKLEQQRADAERKREEEDKKKRKEHAKRVTRMLEAAFDGDTLEIKSVLEEVGIPIMIRIIVQNANILMPSILMQVRKLCSQQDEEIIARSQYMLIECTDANKNTPLSEAASGGNEDAIRLEHTC